MVNAGIIGQNGKKARIDIFENLYILLKATKAKFSSEGNVMLITKRINT